MRCSPVMSISSPPSNDDVINFAKHLGLDGLDVDLFYELYYDLDNEEYESVFDLEYETL